MGCKLEAKRFVLSFSIFDVRNSSVKILIVPPSLHRAFVLALWNMRLQVLYKVQWRYLIDVVAHLFFFTIHYIGCLKRFMYVYLFEPYEGVFNLKESGVSVRCMFLH